MEDRHAQLACLHAILQLQALPQDLPPGVIRALSAFTEHLLAPLGGKHIMLDRLIMLIRVRHRLCAEASVWQG